MAESSSIRASVQLRRVRPRLRARAAACALASLAFAGWSQDKASEYEVKAGYLVNFAKFLSFDSGKAPRGSFDICILGRDPIGRTIDRLVVGQAVNKTPLRVVRIPDPTSARPCAVLFISAAERPDLREDMALLTGLTALTVSDLPDFLDHGGMIQFVNDGGRIRFSVNLDAVNRAHLTLSSELLRVAVAVKGSAQPGGQQ